MFGPEHSQLGPLPLSVTLDTAVQTGGLTEGPQNARGHRRRGDTRGPRRRGDRPGEGFTEEVRRDVVWKDGEEVPRKVRRKKSGQAWERTVPEATIIFTRAAAPKGSPLGVVDQLSGWGPDGTAAGRLGRPPGPPCVGQLWLETASPSPGGVHFQS